MFLTILLILVPMILFWNYSIRKKRMELTSNISGPRVYPIIGNLFVLYRRTIDELMEFIASSIAQYGKIVRIWTFNQLLFFVTDTKALETILASPKYIKKSALYNSLIVWLGDGLLMSNGRKWFQRRKVITPTFHFKILEDFVEIFNENSLILIDQLKERCGKGVFDINPYITRLALDTIAETSLGTKIHAQTNPDSEYVRAVYIMSDIVMERVIRPYLRNELIFKLFAPNLKRQQDKSIKILHNFTEKIIEERREILLKNNGTDTIEYDEFGRKRKMALLDVLLQATVDGQPLSSEDIREEVDTFTFEGHDTTTAGISFTLYLLARHPEIQNKVFAEIREVIGDDKSVSVGQKDLNELKYLELVIKESLRLYPPVPLIGRKLDEDLRIGDKILPAGSEISIPIFMILKDPEVFPNPDRFDPERFSSEKLADNVNPYAYIPFSAGPRNCIGQKFAMLEMKSTVSKVLRNFELLPLGEDAKTIINLVTRSVNGINVGIVPRVYA